MSKIAIDIDGTICEERNTFERCLAKPNLKARDIINKLKKNGNKIIFFTARGWQEYAMTENWLKENKFEYDMLICGKVHYDIYIDDRSIFPDWEKIESKYIKL